MDFSSLQQTPAPKRVAAYVAIVALGGAMGGYAIHEHHAAKNLTAQNEKMAAALNANRSELSDLTAVATQLATEYRRPRTQMAEDLESLCRDLLARDLIEAFNPDGSAGSSPR